MYRKDFVACPRRDVAAGMFQTEPRDRWVKVVERREEENVKIIEHEL